MHFLIGRQSYLAIYGNLRVPLEDNPWEGLSRITVESWNLQRRKSSCSIYDTNHRTPSRSFYLFEIGRRQLIYKPQSQSRMLQHVVETEIFDLIFASVDFIVRILEVRLNHKRRGVPSFRSRGMIRACVSTFRQHIRDIAILLGVSRF